MPADKLPNPLASDGDTADPKHSVWPATQPTKTVGGDVRGCRRQERSQRGSGSGYLVNDDRAASVSLCEAAHRDTGQSQLRPSHGCRWRDTPGTTISRGSLGGGRGLGSTFGQSSAAVPASRARRGSRSLRPSWPAATVWSEEGRPIGRVDTTT